MKHALLAIVGVVAIAASPVFSQSSSSPKFEATSVQASARTAPGLRGGILRGNRYERRNATMLDLIRTAYDVPATRVPGPPHFDNIQPATPPAIAPIGKPMSAPFSPGSSHPHGATAFSIAEPR